MLLRCCVVFPVLTICGNAEGDGRANVRAFHRCVLICAPGRQLNSSLGNVVPACFAVIKSANLAAVCALTTKDEFCIVLVSLTDGSTVSQSCSATILANDLVLQPSTDRVGACDSCGRRAQRSVSGCRGCVCLALAGGRGNGGAPSHTAGPRCVCWPFVGSVPWRIHTAWTWLKGDCCHRVCSIPVSCIVCRALCTLPGVCQRV